MLHKVRLALVAAFAAILVSGFVAPVVAAQSDDKAVQAECRKSAEDQGLDGQAAVDAIEECVAEASKK